MAFERVTFEVGSQVPRFWPTYATIGIPLFVSAWIVANSLAVGVFFGLASALIALLVWQQQSTKAYMKFAIDAFRQRGHQMDFQLGTLLIDSKAKVLAFVNLRQKSMDCYSARDILEWNHHWVDKTTTQVNAWGNLAHSRTRATQNEIVIKTNNPACPIYKIPIRGHGVGQVWMARLSAIVNG
jgi:hypothetical protein